MRAWWLIVVALAACQRPSRARAPEEIVGDQLVLSGPIEFELDDATLRPGALAILDEVVAFLRAHPEITLVEIQGHLDYQPDREIYGRRPSRDRAEAVRDYLVHEGIDPDRLTAEGYESSVPRVPYDDPDAAATNRRIELWIRARR